ncbi:hypothetical protein LSAT2_003601 [Lamellibrachia satsuma]|nr:hypothetical protein LSAT2_003601 [Lamellibrachia satsuma]
MDDAVHEIQPMAFLVSCERNVFSEQEFASQDLSGLGFGTTWRCCPASSASYLSPSSTSCLWHPGSLWRVWRCTSSL